MYSHDAMLLRIWLFNIVAGSILTIIYWMFPATLLPATKLSSVYWALHERYMYTVLYIATQNRCKHTHTVHYILPTTSSYARPGVVNMRCSSSSSTFRLYNRYGMKLTSLNRMCVLHESATNSFVMDGTGSIRKITFGFNENLPLSPPQGSYV